MASLFKDKKLKEILKDYNIPDFDKKLEIIKLWYKAYKDGSLKEKTESQCEQAFNKDFFEKILEYTTFPNEIYTIDPKANTEASGQKPDAILGYFSKEKTKVVAVVEIKDMNKPLDKSQQREGNLTPIQQAFKYKPQYKNCEFVIATNFYETRLLKDNQLDYESFTLDNLLDEKDNYFQFKKFYYLLNANNFISKGNKTKIEELVSEIKIEQEEITKSFYKLYKDLRLNLMRDIWGNNKDKQNIDFIIKKAQKIIDRVVFICFCEDKELLPDNTLEKVLQQSEDNLMSLWGSLKGLFDLIDTGSDKLEIPEGYNGGLFREDEELNSLKISDKVLKELLKIGHYDFEYDLSVNILGHIFEQSISDLEEVKNKVDKIEIDKKVSKRKKDGIFYTPDYIVDYIVKNSLGRYLEEKEIELKEKYNLKEDIQDKTYKDREKKVYLEYQNFLQNIKVLDPACGSGAFLVRVFDYLLEENKRIGKILFGENIIANLDNYYKNILKNNIFGVDLNEESVEITRLSLWLKTAQKGKKLTTLDDNIKCGNSLIDDESVAGEKAFKWEKEFKEIMDNGGFNIIVGNPPYGVKFNDEEKKYLKKLDELVPDREIYIYFISKGLKVLKDNGILSYIFPNTFLSNFFGKNYRNSILSLFYIFLITDLSNDDTFVDAQVRTCILNIKKSRIEGTTSLSKIEKTSKIINLFNFINKKDLLVNIDNWLKFFSYSKESETIINKINNGSNKLINYFDVSQGLIPYDKYRGHDEYTIKNRIYNAVLKKDETYKKELKGEDIKRYNLNWNGNTWISYGNWLAAPREKRFFTSERILIREIVGESLYCTYVDEEYYNTPSIINVIEKKDASNTSLLYLLCILNSKLMAYYHQNTSPKAKKGLFPKILVNDVKNLPIKIALDKQNLFDEKAEFIISKNKGLREKLNKFIELLKSNFRIEKISAKLENWYGLEFVDFKKELKKLKIELNGKNEEDWLDRFNRFKKEALEIKDIIDKTDKEIDQMVYKLYELNEEEIKIVENN